MKEQPILRTPLFLLCLGLFVCVEAAAQGDRLPYDTSYQSSYYRQKLSLFRLLPNTEREIVFLGNSLTGIAEWAELWQNPQVKNRGISSDITFGVLHRLDEVTESKPEKIFLLIGINDIARGIPDSVILQNYRKIIQRIKKESPHTQLYIQSLLPTNPAYQEYKGYQQKEAHILAVNKGLWELAQANKLPYIDLHRLFADADGKLDLRYTNDGLHVNGHGYLRWKAHLEEGGYCCR